MWHNALSWIVLIIQRFPNTVAHNNKLVSLPFWPFCSMFQTMMTTWLWLFVVSLLLTATYPSIGDIFSNRRCWQQPEGSRCCSPHTESWTCHYLSDCWLPTAMRLHGLLYCSSHLLKGGQQEMEIEVRDVRKYNLVDHVNFVIPRNGLICYHPPNSYYSGTQ